MLGKRTTAVISSSEKSYWVVALSSALHGMEVGYLLRWTPDITLRVDTPIVLEYQMDLDIRTLAVFLILMRGRVYFLCLVTSMYTII